MIVKSLKDFVINDIRGNGSYNKDNKYKCIPYQTGEFTVSDGLGNGVQFNNINELKQFFIIIEN